MRVGCDRGEILARGRDIADLRMHQRRIVCEAVIERRKLRRAVERVPGGLAGLLSALGEAAIVMDQR